MVLGQSGSLSLQAGTVNVTQTVNGTTTSINSTTVNVDDKNIVLADTASPSDATSDGGGITLKGTTDKTFNWIDANGKHVIVIGGGDTGSDCIGTSNRMGAASVTQFEILDRPPDHEDKGAVWPYWPLKMRTSSSQEEGCDRDWNILTKKLSGKDGKVEKLHAVRVQWVKGADGRVSMKEVAGSEFELKADLVLLAMGFTGPVRLRQPARGGHRSEAVRRHAVPHGLLPGPPRDHGRRLAAGGAGTCGTAAGSGPDGDCDGLPRAPRHPGGHRARPIRPPQYRALPPAPGGRPHRTPSGPPS